MPVISIGAVSESQFSLQNTDAANQFSRLESWSRLDTSRD